MILTFLYTILVFFYLYRYGNSHWGSKNKWFLPTVFIGKFICAFFFLYVYTYHYGGGELTADAGRFFQESEVFHKLFYSDTKMYFKFFFGLENNPQIVDSFLPELSHWNATTRVLPNDSRNVIRINSLLFFVSNGQILVHFLFFSFISFIAGLDLAKFLNRYSNFPYSIIVLVLVLTPSIAFWTSSIIKEPFMIAGFYFVIRGVFDVDQTFAKRLIRLLIGGGFMLMFKPYVFITFLPFLIFFYGFSFWKIYNYSKIVNVAIFAIFGGLILFASGKATDVVHLISRQQQDFMNVRDGGLYLSLDEEYYYYVYFENRNNFDIQGNTARLLAPTGCYIAHKSNYPDRRMHQLEDIGKEYNIEVRMTEAGSGIELTRINKSGWVMMKIIPEVLINTVIRPWPWDKGSWLKFPPFIENVFLLFFLIVSFVFGRKIKPLEERWLWTLGLFALSFFIIVGWTTPVLGAIVRYKIPATAALLVVILIKLDYPRFRNALRFGQKSVKQRS